MSNIVVNIADVEEVAYDEKADFVSYCKPLTPALQPRIGRLGMNVTRVPPGQCGCPFHTHAVEDEVFFVLSGRGVLRYGDTVRAIRPGDCISCPAGTGLAHQLANPFEDDLTYLAIGMNDPNEVCTYPDNGKVFVRALKTDGFLKPAPYYEGEPSPPLVFAMAAARH